MTKKRTKRDKRIAEKFSWKKGDIVILKKGRKKPKKTND